MTRSNSWLDYPLGDTASRHLGRALIGASRVLARAGAALVGHPSARQAVPRPELKVVRSESVRTVAIDPVVEEWFHKYPGVGR